MSGMFGGGAQPVNSAAPVISGLRVQTSAYGRPIPLVYGQTRVAANVIWYNDFRAIEHRTRQSAGGKGGGGGGSTESISHTYQVAVALGIAEGPISAIQTAWAGKKTGSISEWNLSAYNGDYAQQPLGYIQSKHPEQAFSYRGTAYVGTGVLDLGGDATLPNMTFEVKGVAANYQLDKSKDHWQANPRDVVLDYCTNPNYGAGIAASKFGDLTRFSDFCVANGLFISPAYTEQEPAREAVARLFQIAGSGVYYSEGKIKAVPFSDMPVTGNGVTYAPDMSPIYDLDDDDFLADGEDPVRCDRVAPSDAYNCIKLKFYNRDKGYNEDVVEAKDQASIEQTGLRPKDVEMHEIVDPDVARLVAQQILQRTLYIRNTYEFRLGWKYALLEPTDLVTLTDDALGLNRALVRIVEIEEDEDGELAVKAEEVPVGTVGATRYPTQTSDGYSVNFNTPPGSINPPVIFEPPLALAGSPEIWIAASGGENWGGCEIWVSDDNMTYQRMGRIIGKSRHGSLTRPLPVGAGIDTTNTLGVDLSVSGGELLPATEQNATELVTLCYTDGELLAYRDATLTGINEYTLGFLVRGAYGSPITAHAAGKSFARLDQSIAKFGYDKAKIGKTLYLKFQSYNIHGTATEDLAELTPVTYLITGAPLGTVTGLALEQPFIGDNCQIKWNEVDAAVSYTVEVWAGSPQTLRRTVSVGDARRFAYSWQDARADGGPWRQMTFRVRGVSKTGTAGGWATLVASNPVPAALTGIQCTGSYNSIFFNCNPSAEPDAAGIMIWLSAVSGFTPSPATLVYDGNNWFTTINTTADGATLVGNKPYYLRAAAYDNFGKDGLIISSETVVTPVSVSGGVKPGEIESTMIKAVEAAKVVGTLKDWQLDGMAASKLQGQVQLTQLAADVQGNLSSAVSTANQALSKANEAATATSVQQLTARLAPAGDIGAAIAGKAAQAALDAAVTRLTTAETTLATRAAAADLLALSVSVSRRKTYRIATFGASATRRPAIPTHGLFANGALLQGGVRSYNVVTFTAAGEFSAIKRYDVHAAGAITGGEGAAAMAAYLNNLPIGTLVAVFTYDEPLDLRLTGGLPEAMYRCGATAAVFGSANFMSRSVYVLIGKISGIQGTAYEAYVGSVSADPDAWVDLSFDIVDGNFAGISPAAGMTVGAALNRVSQVETAVAGRALASDVTTLTARAGTLEASVTQVQTAQASLDGKVSSKWGVVLGATTPDGRQTLSGVQAFNDGRTSQFVITTDQLLVQAAGSALNADPCFADRTAWVALSGEWQSVALTDGKVGVTALRSRNGEVASAKALPFDPQKTYRVHGSARGAEGANGRLFLGVQLFDGQGQNIAGNGSYWYTSVSSVGSGWTEFNGTIGPSGTLISPAHARSFRPLALVNYGGTVGYMELQDLRLEEVLPGTLIQPGAINTDHLAAKVVRSRHVDTDEFVANSGIVGKLVADQVFINQARTNILQSEVVKSGHIDSRNLTIKDAAGNVIFGAGQNLDATRVAGLGALATKHKVAATDMVVGQLSAIAANLGTVTSGKLSIQSSGDGDWGAVQSGSKWWYDGQPGWVLARHPDGRSLLEFSGGSTLFRMSSWGDCILKFGTAIEMRGDGYLKVNRLSVTEPDIVAQGNLAVTSPQLNGDTGGSWDAYIDTGITAPVGWSTAISQMYVASATISGGYSDGGGASGFAEATVLVGDGLSSGSWPHDNRIYIRYSISVPVTGAGRFTITSIAWKLARI